jgi:TonB family protein
MKWIISQRRCLGYIKSALLCSLVLMFVWCLQAADAKRVRADEALRAVTSRTKPEYNAIARQLKLSGEVSVDVIIAEDGSVESASVVRGNPVLGKLAVDAVKQWRFVPFKSDGKTIKVVSEIAIQFNI